MARSTPDLQVEAAVDRTVELIESSSQLALACHVSPDGDALGSLLALHHLCRNQGRPSLASWSEPFEVAPHYRYLPGLDTCTKPADFPPEPAVMMTFDCGSLARLGDLATPAEWAREHGELVVVDHHGSNERFGTVNLIDDAAAATAVIVRRLAARLDWPLTRDVAVCLYTGLVTDTGRFQYPSTTPEVFALAEELAEFDLPLTTMTRQLFEEHRFAYLQLAAMAIARAVLRVDISFVATWITIEDLERFDCHIDEAEGLIDLIRRTSEADVSCVLKETDQGIKVSLRSISHDDRAEMPSVDVAAIATELGGGGHRYAAGFTAQGSVEEVLHRIEAAVEAARR